MITFRFKLTLLSVAFVAASVSACSQQSQQDDEISALKAEVDDLRVQVQTAQDEIDEIRNRPSIEPVVTPAIRQLPTVAPRTEQTESLSDRMERLDTQERLEKLERDQRNEELQRMFER